MRISILGHASMYLESGATRVLLDPILRTEAFGGGSSAHYLERELRLDRMPPPTVLALTHAHHDHLDPKSLALLDRDIQVVAPRDPDTLGALERLGFHRIAVLDPWSSFTVGAMRIIATPSECDVREVGYVFESPDGRIWDMCDSEANGPLGERVRREIGPCDVVAARYQPSNDIMTGIFRCLGPRFDRHRVVAWAEAAAATAPKLVFPYASGVAFVGRYDWLNRYLFPFSSAYMAELFTQRLAGAGKGATVNPGDVVTIRRGAAEIEPQACEFVRYVPRPGDEPAWEPIEAHRLAGLDSARERAELTERLLSVLRGPWARWLVTLDASLLVELGVVWQLVIHMGDGERLCFALDFTEKRLQLVGGELAHANVFAHIAGRSLLDVLRQEVGPDAIYATADSLTYERIMGVKDGRFWAPKLADSELADRIPNLLTHYLRWAGPADGVTSNEH